MLSQIFCTLYCHKIINVLKKDRIKKSNLFYHIFSLYTLHIIYCILPQQVNDVIINYICFFHINQFFLFFLNYVYIYMKKWYANTQRIFKKKFKKYYYVKHLLFWWKFDNILIATLCFLINKKIKIFIHVLLIDSKAGQMSIKVHYQYFRVRKPTLLMHQLTQLVN